MLAFGSIGAGQVAFAATLSGATAMESDPVTGIAEQPEALAAKQAIAELLFRYCQVVRYDCPEEAASLYTDDGVFEVRRGSCDKAGHSVDTRLEGRENLRAYMRTLKGKPHPVPLIHNLMIEVDGDLAQGTCVMEARVSTGEAMFWGEYRDRYARLDGRWHFAERVFTIFVEGSRI